MQTKRIATILALTGMLAILFAATATTDAVAGRKGFVGAWSVLVTSEPPGPPPFTNLVTFTRDGNLLNSSPTFGTGHGTWVRLRHRKIGFTFVTLVPSVIPDFPPDTSFTVSGTLTLDRAGNEATGPVTTAFNDADGNELFSEVGVLELTRIKVDKPNDEDDEDD